MSLSAMSQPVASRFAPEAAQFSQLCRALDAGWRIEPPIYRRHQWFGQDEPGYYFILKRNAEVDLLVVTECEAVRRWVREQRLRVIAS